MSTAAKTSRSRACANSAAANTREKTVCGSAEKPIVSVSGCAISKTAAVIPIPARRLCPIAPTMTAVAASNSTDVRRAAPMPITAAGTNANVISGRPQTSRSLVGWCSTSRAMTRCR